MPHDLADAIARASAHLAAAGVTGPDAEILAAHVTGRSLGELRMRALTGAELDDADVHAFERLVNRRAAREPLQHLTGEAHFRHLSLQVGPGVFVPRPETELLVDVVLEHAAPGSLVVDVGTGSGAIALAIATELEGARVVALERSKDALAWAARNVASIAPGVDVREGDMADALGDLAGRVDALVSNPPYIPLGMVPRDPEVRDHDPHAALFSGADGLDAIRILARRGIELVRTGGLIALEHAEHQGPDVRAILGAEGWRDASSRDDLTGRCRVTFAFR